MNMEADTLLSVEYPKNFLKSLHVLYNRKVLVDCRLIFQDGEVLQAHKCVLAAASRYLQAQIEKGAMTTSGVLQIQTVSSSDFLLLLDFMYSGKLQLNQSNVWSITSAAAILDMPEAVQLCQQFVEMGGGLVKPGLDQLEKETVNMAGASISRAEENAYVEHPELAVSVKEDPDMTTLATESVEKPDYESDDEALGLNDKEGTDDEYLPPTELVQSSGRSKSARRKVGRPRKSNAKSKTSKEKQISTRTRKRKRSTKSAEPEDTDEVIVKHEEEDTEYHKSSKSIKENQQTQSKRRKRSSKSKSTNQNHSKESAHEVVTDNVPTHGKKRVTRGRPQHLKNSQRSKWTKHLAKNSSKEDNIEVMPRYQCDQCSYRFFHNSTLQLHKRNHNMKPAYLTYLEKCHKYHPLRYHRQIKPVKLKGSNEVYPCLICEKKFTSRVKTRQHMIRKHQHHSVTLPCDKCKKTFRSGLALLCHRIMKHKQTSSTLGINSCGQCVRIYIHRASLERHLSLEHKASTCKKKSEHGSLRRSYTASFKLTVIKVAKKKGNRASGRQYGIDESTIRGWRKMEHKLKKMPKDKKADRTSQAKHPVLEEHLKSWLFVQKKRDKAVSAVKIRMQALAIAQEMKIKDFGANPSWCNRFMKRHSLSLRDNATCCKK